MKLAFEAACLCGIHNWWDTGAVDRIYLQCGEQERSQIICLDAGRSPLVSVVIPTHNRPDMLAEALASVRAQTFTDYEIIVISNGEGDETRRASRKIAAGCVYLELDQGNVSTARNHGIAHAKGEWIALLDDDDLWLPKKLERQIAEAERTSADMIACDYVQFYLDGSEIVRRARLIEGWTYPKAISHGYWWGLPSSVMVRKNVMEKLGGFDPRQRIGEDLDMWRRLSWNHKIHQIEEVLARYRSGHPSMMMQERTRYLYDLRLYLKMWRDSPRHLRHTIPAFGWYVPPRLVGILAPNWLLAFLHWLEPRRKWLEFRLWLKPRTRLIQFRYWLGARWTSTRRRFDLP